MGYIGNSLQQQLIQPATDFFSGNGSTTNFTLTRTPLSVYTVEVVVNNVQQHPQTSYYINGNTLIFYSPPPSGSNNIYVVYNPVITQAGQPGYGTVGNAQLAAITNIASGGNSFNIQTGSPGVTALTIDTAQNVSTPNSLRYQETGEKFLGVTGFSNGVSNLAVNILFGNNGVGGKVEITIASSYNYQNAGGGIKKIFSLLANPNNNIYTSESRVVEAIGPIVTQFAIGEFQWDSATSQYIIPISHLVSTANAVYVTMKVYGQGNTANMLANTTLATTTYTLSPLNRNYEYFNNNVGIGTSNPSYPLTVSSGDIYSSGALRPWGGQARLHFYSFSEGTMGGGYVHMKTNVYQTDTQMYSVHFSGHDYSGAKSISATLGWYNYQPSNGPISIGGNAGTHSVTAYKSSDGYTVMCIGPTGGYYTAFTVSQYLTTQGLANLTISAAKSTGSSSGAY